MFSLERRRLGGGGDDGHLQVSRGLSLYEGEDLLSVTLEGKNPLVENTGK